MRDLFPGVAQIVKTLIIIEKINCMSNYYISNCCSAQVSYLDVDNLQGLCNDCKEPCGLVEVVEDED